MNKRTEEILLSYYQDSKLRGPAWQSRANFILFVLSELKGKRVFEGLDRLFPEMEMTTTAFGWNYE
jgi:hypothetical protein